MTEHPIIFSTPMVQAILEGRKTMTRRIIGNGINFLPDDTEFLRFQNYADGTCRAIFHNGDEPGNVKCPYGKAGDILWVRETWSKTNRKEVIIFKAPEMPEPTAFRWKPSIHMPRKFARIFLRIDRIGVERLQAISPDDVKKEGVRYRVIEKGSDMVSPLWRSGDNGAIEFMPKGFKDRPLNADELMYAHWAELWCDINGRASWDANPWVWVVEFSVISTNEKLK